MARVTLLLTKVAGVKKKDFKGGVTATMTETMMAARGTLRQA